MNLLLRGPWDSSMLHRIELCPHCEKILMAVLRLQEAILVYVRAPGSVWPPSDPDFPAITQSAAQWFIGKLQRGANLTKFGTALKALFDHVRGDLLRGQKILEAFQNDVKFPKSVNDPGFEFEFARLDAATQKILKELMVLFYETLAGANFPGAVHGEAEEFTRDLLLEGFERANPKLRVCPACDGQKPSKLDAKKLLADADHYLPKSLYPFLAVHPGNLVPLCLECNQRIKGDTDPVLDHAATPLANIFLPYVLPAADHLELRLRRDGGKGLVVEFHDKSAPGSRRLESLQAIFALDRRWPDRLDDQKASVVDTLIAAGERRRVAGEEVSEKALESLLTTSPSEAERYTGKSPFFLLKRSYQEFALHDPPEKLGLFAQFEGK